MSSQDLAHECASLAVNKVKESGGFITFEQYDEQMLKEQYFIPFMWGSHVFGIYGKSRKSAKDKLCAFAACERGLIIKEEYGYRLNNKKDSK